jgi:hypothetical protein
VGRSEGEMSANIRLERIEKLLYELKYEITRGMMDREIEEEMGFEFLIPVSKHFPRGVVVLPVFIHAPWQTYRIGTPIPIHLSFAW